MSKNTVIQVNNLSKLYRLGEIGTGTLSHDLNRFFAKLRGKEDPYSLVGQTNDRTALAESDYVWALKDINFEVQKGEVLGIIGKNGAGKSTLLKLISQITSPTKGTIKAKGRIASLLEVGTGMHPEMTARENIFLNGAILGMTKKEIKSKFNEIIEFAGCQMYVDTPLKRFSSGMRVRLGFAVAAFLEPEILIVDEVLAVGDAEFQKKAIGKMKDISSGGGRTVLFVSHNMASVKSLCTRVIVLENGGIKFNGDIDSALKNYMSEGSTNGINEFKEFKWDKNYANEKVTIKSIGIKAVSKKYGDPICLDDEIELSLSFLPKCDNRLDATIQFKDSFGNYLFALSSVNVKSLTTINGIINCKVKIPGNFFTANTFHLNLLIVQNGKNVVFKIEDILVIDVLPKQNEVGQFMGKGKVPLTPQFKWEITE
jgi:lipopolysaccharide transport system ATP-binding protein